MQRVDWRFVMVLSVNVALAASIPGMFLIDRYGGVLRAALTPALQSFVG